MEKDGYSALQLGFGERRPIRTSKAELGHFQKANAAPQRYLAESRVTPDEAAGYEAGAKVTVEVFTPGPAGRRGGNLEGARHPGRRAAP